MKRTNRCREVSQAATMRLALVIVIAGIISDACNAFQFHSRSSTPNPTEQSRRDVLVSTAAGIVGISVIAPPQPAFAERSLSTVTESYRRYVPRMETGFEFLANGLKDMIESGDAHGVIAELTAEKGTKISAMKGTMRVGIKLGFA